MTQLLELPASHALGDTHRRRAGRNQLPHDQTTRDAQVRPVVRNPLGESQTSTDIQRSRALSKPFEEANPSATSKPEPLPLSSPLDLALKSGDTVSGELYILTETFDDIEKLRIATGNRLAQLTARGMDLPVLHDHAAALQAVEHQLELAIKRCIRKHPLHAWIKRSVGIGEKQAARLIAVLGDPSWNAAADRLRRGPAELWAYCGLAPTQKRTKGKRDTWNATAKTRAILCATSCIKQLHSPYRHHYDHARRRWQDKPTTDLHKHNHALRVVAKEILRDLYNESITLRSDLADEADRPRDTRQTAHADAGNIDCEFAGHAWANADGGLQICMACNAERWADR